MKSTSAPLLPILGFVTIGHQRFVKFAERASPTSAARNRVLLGLRKPKGRVLFVAWENKDNGYITEPVRMPGSRAADFNQHLDRIASEKSIA